LLDVSIGIAFVAGRLPELARLFGLEADLEPCTRCLVESNKSLPREKILDHMKGYADFSSLERLDDADLLAVYCEGLVAMAERKKT